MAETKRMTVEQVVSYLLEEDGLDFLRESLTWVAGALGPVLESARPTALEGRRIPARSPVEVTLLFLWR
jgi:hypothetical protein